MAERHRQDEDLERIGPLIVRASTKRRLELLVGELRALKRLANQTVVLEQLILKADVSSIAEGLPERPKLRRATQKRDRAAP
jgi:hypothetical protein